MKRYWPWFFLIALVCILFWPTIARGEIPFPGNYLLAWYEPWKSQYASGGVPTIAHKPVADDVFRHLYPLRLLAVERMKNGEWPLWNPYNAAGTPLLAIFHPGYLNPFGIVFFLFSPATAWALFILFQIPVLGAAMYLYGRCLRWQGITCVFATATLLLSGFVVVRLEYGEFLYVLAVLPLLLAVCERLTAVPTSRLFLAVPILVAFVFVSGQPHMGVYILGVFALYAAVCFWRQWRMLVRLALSSLLGVGLAGLQILPSLELYRESTITRQTSQFIFERFLLPVSHLITVGIPNYFGSQATYNFFGHGDYVETIASVGLIPLFFALRALWSKGKNSSAVRLFFLLTIFSVVATLDWAGARFLYRLPLPVLSADVPSRAFAVTTFSLAVLSGYGFERWRRRLPKERSVNSRVFLFFGLVLVLVVATLAAYFLGLPCPREIPQCRLVSLRNTLLEVAVFGTFISLFLLRFRYPRLDVVRRSVPVVTLLVAVALGLYNAGKFLPFSEKDAILPEAGVLTALREISGEERFWGIGRAAFRTNLTTHFRLNSVEYFDPLHIRRYAQLVSFGSTGDPSSGVQRSDVLLVNEATPAASVAARRQRFLDAVSTRYVVYNKEEVPTLGSTAVWEDAYWAIVENKSAVARTYTVNAYEVVRERGEILDRLFDPSFNLAQTVILEEEPSVAVAREGHAQIHATEFREQSVTLAVEADASTLLVLTDTYYPGWKAFVGEQETPIYRANFAFRAVVVPRGTHTVRFRYQPQSFVWGVRLSLVSLAVYGFVLVSVLGAKSRRSGAWA